MSISSRIQQLASIKTDIKASIIAKGVTVTDDMTQYATAISQISGSLPEDTLFGTSATITTTVSNGTATGATTIDNEATVTIVPNEGYNLPLQIQVANATYTYNNNTGVISLSAPVGNVTIQADCSTYEEPIKEDDKLIVSQVMVINQSENVLEVE